MISTVNRRNDFSYNDSSTRTVPDSGGPNVAGKYGGTVYSPGNTRTEVVPDNYSANYAPARLPVAPGLTFEGNPKTLSNYESKNTSVSQRASDVYRDYVSGIKNIIGGTDGNNGLTGLVGFANSLRNSPLELQTSLGLSSDIKGSNALRDAMSGGIDYYGRLGLSEGVQNLRAQENAANNALQARLGRNAANSSLIAALQNQNRMRTQMAINPLLSEAQRGSYERGLTGIGLDNQKTQLLNAILGQEGNFKNQSLLSQLQARLAGIQPTQSLLEALIALQAQGRGVTSSENVLGGKNFT